jgi:hypothetical protein
MDTQLKCKMLEQYRSTSLGSVFENVSFFLLTLKQCDLTPGSDQPIPVGQTVTLVEDRRWQITWW